MTLPSLPPTALALTVALLAGGCAVVAPPPGGTAPATAATPAAGAPTTPGAAAPGARPPAGTTAAATPAGAAAGAAATPPRPPAPGQPPPFAEVTRDAKSQPGLITVWTRDDRTWLEIPAMLLDKPLSFGQTLASGIGEGLLLPGLMGRGQTVVLRRVGNGVQLLARNQLVRAPGNAPTERTIAESFSDSLLAAAPLAAAPHPQRQSLLVDAASLLGGDIFSLQPRLEAQFRLPYAVDRSNTAVERVSTTPEGLALTVRTHFALPRLPSPVPGGSSGPASRPPSNLPDARSFFLSLVYTLEPVPAEPMAPRRADPRVGYFTQAYTDLGNELGGDRRVHMVARWRLDKQDPAAEVSDVVRPVRVVMDRNIPLKWRPTVRAGILEWNQAFERAGLRGALAVEQQPEDADWTVFELPRVLAVRWFAMNGPGALAVGPSQSDPRTGEILRAAAIVPENWVRVGRSFLRERQPRLPGLGPTPTPPAGPGPSPGPGPRSQSQSQSQSANASAHGGGVDVDGDDACGYALDALAQTEFALGVLQSRGLLDPRSPESDRYIEGALKDVVMHEVGHALGLRHNFKGSLGFTSAQLRDPVYTAANGISNSVMDYVPVNLALPDEPLASYQMLTLGAYDHWAIEYGYRPLPRDGEAAALAKIAARSDREPALAFGTDEDADGGDPAANRFDLGDDPVAFAQRQLRLARELWDRTQTRELDDDDDYGVYRSNLLRGFSGFNQSVPLLAKHVGGTYTSRALASAKRPLFVPVAAAVQRQALGVMLTEVFASDSFRFDPQFLSRLGVDQLDRAWPWSQDSGNRSGEFSLPEAVLAVQRGALDALMADQLAARIANNESRVADPRELVSFSEVQQSLLRAVWSELRSGRDIDSLRRNLQREHLRRLAGGVLRPASSTAADVRAVQRQAAQTLEAELRQALARRDWSDTARAHLADSQATLAEALKAPLLKQGV